MSSEAPLTMTWSCIVRPWRGWIPMRAWIKIMGSPSPGAPSSSSPSAQHLDDEEMFVEELVAVGEEFITMEALAVLPTLSNFYRG
jgi:hypothetical protein